MTKTIFDILRFFIENPRGERYNLRIDNFVVNLDEHLEIRLRTDQWWFVFPETTSLNSAVSVDKPVDNRYDTIILPPEIFEDLFTMDDNQLILSYGRFYPDYLHGDLSSLYDTIKKEICS